MKDNTPSGVVLLGRPDRADNVEYGTRAVIIPTFSRLHRRAQLFPGDASCSPDGALMLALPVRLMCKLSGRLEYASRPATANRSARNPRMA